jgi:hypothetical protein
MNQEQRLVFLLFSSFILHPSEEDLTMNSNSAPTAREPRIIIVGGGFGGIAAARA